VVFPSEPSRTVARAMRITETVATQRGGAHRKPATARTSLLLAPQERALLERVADAEQASIAEILRRGFHLYAATHNYGEVQAA